MHVAIKRHLGVLVLWLDQEWVDTLAKREKYWRRWLLRWIANLAGNSSVEGAYMEFPGRVVIHRDGKIYYLVLPKNMTMPTEPGTLVFTLTKEEDRE